MKLVVLLLTLIYSVGSPGATPLFQRQLNTQGIQYNRSVYLRQHPAFVLGSEKPYRLLKELQTIGVKHLTIELRVVVENETASRVNFGTYRGATKEQYRSFIAASHVFGMAVTLKPVFVLSDGETFVQPNPSNLPEFIESYGSFISFLSKVTRQSDADEIVIGTGLNHILCQSPEEVASLVRRFQAVQGSLETRYRLDFSSPSEAQVVEACASNQKVGLEVQKTLSLFKVFGVDLPVNPSVNDAVKSLNKNLILSRVSFDGEQKIQAENAKQFFNSIGSNYPITIGVFTTDFWAQGEFDKSDSPRGKPLTILMTEWFK